MTEHLFTNSSGPDTVRNAFALYSGKPCEIRLASPFFSDDGIVHELIRSQCRVRLLVRLGPATSPKALTSVMRHDNVQIRYFTSRQFHTKLYLFGHRMAIVGSANLTDAGLQRNRELALGVQSTDPRFEDLVRLYERYWMEAEVLTEERCRAYANLKSRTTPPKDDPFEEAVKREFGDVVPTGLQVGLRKPDKQLAFVSDYRRTYQEFLAAFSTLRERYEADGRRMQPDSLVPLRIEIDLFCSFIRERYTTGDSFNDEPIRYGDDLTAHIDARLADWFAQRWSYLDTHTPGHFSRINSALSSPDKIRGSSADELFDALDVCHSIHDRKRFFKGGHSTLKTTFLEQNTTQELRSVLEFLLYGPGDFVERMASCIYDDAYSLNQFGRSAVQELFGWVNTEEVPICNGRTVKALRYLGFDVDVFT